MELREPHRTPSRGLRRRFPPRVKRQGGAIAVMAPFLIIVILTFIGFAFSLSMVYNRKVELQTAAESIALAAARQLNGTEAGVNMALSAAAAAASSSFYSYNAASIAWSDAAISFSSSPSGPEWVDATSAKTSANASRVFYVKVDLSRLSSAIGIVPTVFFSLSSSGPEAGYVSSTVVAGRQSINVTPLALCAISDNAARNRGGELVEYGFRRGISYNLMKLNPASNTGGANYLVNPVSPPGGGSSTIMSRLDVIRPFVCAGKIAMPSLATNRLRVEPNFPLADVFQQLNSRFGDYHEPCTATTAPPDTNVKEFPFLTAFPWMTQVPKDQSAESIPTSSKLLTIADLSESELPPVVTPDMYGPLWIFAKAAKYSSYSSGSAEPLGGYSTFATSNWPTLYSPGGPSVRSGATYPSTPFTTAPVGPPDGLVGVANRRVLNVPLLRCPVPTESLASAEVLAVGKFFMTVRATNESLYAEFAGIIPKTTLSGPVELYP